MENNQRGSRQRQEEVALNHGLKWVGGAVVLECLLMLVNRYYINFRISEVDIAILVRDILAVLRVGGAVLGLAALVWTAVCLWSGKRAGGAVACLLICWAAAICSDVTLAYQKSGVQMLYLLVPAGAGLALIYYLYQRELFFSASASGLAVLGLWFLRFGSAGREVALVLAGIALVAVAALWMKKTGGLLRPGREETRVLPKDASYLLIWISCLVGAAAMAAAMAFGAMAYYLIFAMVGWLFALLVYYTVKLM